MSQNMAMRVNKMHDVNIYKAWVNVKTKEFQQFSSDIHHYTYTKEHPTKFKLDTFTGFIIENNELVEIENKIDEKEFLENNGWVAVSITKTNGKIEAHVSALTVKNVLDATRLLYKKRHKYGTWDFLQINTTFGDFVFKGQEKIIEYILGK